MYVCDVYSLLQQNAKQWGISIMKNKTIKKQVIFFIFLYYLLYNSGPASTIRETDDEKKHLHSVKYDPKKFKKNYIGQAIMLESYSI